MPIQKGDIPISFANIDNLRKLTGYRPKTKINKGIAQFIDWYKDYHKIKMNIVHLITSIDKGGAENHLSCLIRGQVKK